MSFCGLTKKDLLKGFFVLDKVTILMNNNKLKYQKLIQTKHRLVDACAWCSDNQMTKDSSILLWWN